MEDDLTFNTSYAEFQFKMMSRSTAKSGSSSFHNLPRPQAAVLTCPPIRSMWLLLSLSSFTAPLGPCLLALPLLPATLLCCGFLWEFEVRHGHPLGKHLFSLCCPWIMNQVTMYSTLGYTGFLEAALA